MQGGFWIDKDGAWWYWFGSKKYNRGRGKTFRHIKTTQERRENLDDYDGFRVSGRRRDLPEYRDEIMRHRDKCWKRTRREQYRGSK